MTIFNQVSMIGTLTHTLEKKTHNGRSFVSFQMALNKKWTDRQTGEERNHASFIPVTAWGKVADQVCVSFDKGFLILVFGELRSNSWESEKGERRSRIFIQASHVTEWMIPPGIESQEHSGVENNFSGIDPIHIDPADIPF